VLGTSLLKRERGWRVAIPVPNVRAGNGTRTRDPDLGKVVLYQLSYSRVLFSIGSTGRRDKRVRVTLASALALLVA
jgi:hypothetical protein